MVLQFQTFQTNVAKRMYTFMHKYPLLREFIGEFVGTSILLIFGCGVLAQVILGGNGTQSHGTFISISFGWGLAVFMGVLYAGKSGKGHINPAVTLAMAVTGKLPWNRVLIYILAQHLGAFAGSLMVFGVYSEKIYGYANGTLEVHTTGNIFVTNPHASLTTCFFDQVFGTALLCGGAFAITDKRNFNVPDWAHSLSIALLVTAIVGAYALNAGAALNPARDFGPRVMLFMCGWGSKAFTSGNYYFWIPVVGPHIGALLGAGLYELTVGIYLPDEEAYISSKADENYGISKPVEEVYISSKTDENYGISKPVEEVYISSKTDENYGISKPDKVLLKSIK